jgi:hemoglobin-like flavoprotein
MFLSVQLLEKSLERVRPCQDEFTARFYEKLFAANPELKPLFARTNMVRQGQMFIVATILTINNLHDPQILATSIEGLGASHVGCNATPEYYLSVSQALVSTFAEFLEADWTAQMQQAWIDMFETISKLMSGESFMGVNKELSQVAA